MRGKAKMRHQHQRAVGGLDETARSVRHLAPASALLMCANSSSAQRREKPSGTERRGSSRPNSSR
jgi:hypothetical protein